MTDINCPYCGKLLARVDDVTTRFKGRCSYTPCRRRFTIVEGGKLIVTKADAEADGASKDVNLDSLSMDQLKALVDERSRALDLLIQSLEAEQDKLEKYHNVRIRAHIAEGDARHRVKVNGQAPTKTKVTGDLDKDTQLYRNQLLYFLHKHVEKGKITPVRAEQLIVKSNMSRGLDELADALGVPRWER